MDYYKLQSLTIDWLRFPMMVAVVFIHINPSVNIQEVDYSNFSWEGVYAIVATLGSRVLPHVAVPFFFFTSGYFYFYKIETFVYGEYVKKTYKRLQTLVVPYLVWILIALIVMFLLKPFIENTPRWEYYDFTKKHFYNLFWDYYSNGGDRKSNIFGERVSFSAPYNFPLWFLRDLIVITLFSPLIYFLTKRGKLLFIIILFSLFYTHVWFNIPGFSIEAAFFFKLRCVFQFK